MAIVKKRTANKAAVKKAAANKAAAKAVEVRLQARGAGKTTAAKKYSAGAKSVTLNVQTVGRAKRKTKCEPLPNIITDVKTLTQGFDKPAAPRPHMVLAKNHAGFWEVRAYDPSADYQQIFALTLHERKAQIRPEQIIPPDRFTFRCIGDSDNTIYRMMRVDHNKWAMTYIKADGTVGGDDFSYLSVQKSLAGGWEVLEVELQGLPGQFHVESPTFVGVMKLTQLGSVWGAFEGVYNGHHHARYSRTDVRHLLAIGQWTYISKERYDEILASLPAPVIPTLPKETIDPSWSNPESPNVGNTDVDEKDREVMDNVDGTDPDPQDAVRHPQHYNAHPSGVEAIDILQHFNFNVGNAIKYLWRLGLKDQGDESDIKELRKAREYIDFEIARKQKFPNKG